MFNSPQHFVRKCNLPAYLSAHPVIMRINHPLTGRHKSRKPIYCDGGLLCELFQQGVSSAGRVMLLVSLAFTCGVLLHTQAKSHLKVPPKDAGDLGLSEE